MALKHGEHKLDIVVRCQHIEPAVASPSRPYWQNKYWSVTADVTC
jgi:hypothetical protein